LRYGQISEKEEQANGGDESSLPVLTYRQKAQDYRDYYNSVERLIIDNESKAKSWMGILVGLLSAGVVSGELLTGTSSMSLYFQRYFYFLLFALVMFGVHAFANLLGVLNVSSYALPPVIPAEHLSGNFPEEAFYQKKVKVLAAAIRKNRIRSSEASATLKRGIHLAKWTCGVFALLAFSVVLRGMRPGMVLGAGVGAGVVIALIGWAIKREEDKNVSKNEQLRSEKF